MTAVIEGDHVADGGEEGGEEENPVGEGEDMDEDELEKQAQEEA